MSAARRGDHTEVGATGVPALGHRRHGCGTSKDDTESGRAMAVAPRPIDAQADPTPSPALCPAGEHAGGLILVAESDLPRRERLVAALRLAGYRVAEAADGAEALAR